MSEGDRAAVQEIRASVAGDVPDTFTEFNNEGRVVKLLLSGGDVLLHA